MKNEFTRAEKNALMQVDQIERLKNATRMLGTGCVLVALLSAGVSSFSISMHDYDRPYHFLFGLMLIFSAYKTTQQQLFYSGLIRKILNGQRDSSITPNLNESDQSTR